MACAEGMEEWKTKRRPFLPAAFSASMPARTTGSSTTCDVLLLENTSGSWDIRLGGGGNVREREKRGEREREERKEERRRGREEGREREEMICDCNQATFLLQPGPQRDGHYLYTGSTVMPHMLSSPLQDCPGL